jgi:hypothetical protein
MSGVHVRYFFFTLTVAATLFVARIVVGPHAQSGAAGSTHVAGRVIVKFRDGTSTVARVKSLSLVSAAGAVSERPSYANFDLVRIDPNDDAEGCRRCAETAARRAVRARVVSSTHRSGSQRSLLPAPVDLPMLDLERAWDIQGTTGSSVTVAVLRTAARDPLPRCRRRLVPLSGVRRLCRPG